MKKMDGKHRESTITSAGKEQQISTVGIDPQINEAAADEIEKEWKFKLKRAPENIVTEVGLITIMRKSHYVMISRHH